MLKQSRGISSSRKGLGRETNFCHSMDIIFLTALEDRILCMYTCQHAGCVSLLSRFTQQLHIHPTSINQSTLQLSPFSPRFLISYHIFAFNSERSKMREETIMKGEF